MCTVSPTHIHVVNRGSKGYIIAYSTEEKSWGTTIHFPEQCEEGTGVSVATVNHNIFMLGGEWYNTLKYDAIMKVWTILSGSVAADPIMCPPMVYMCYPMLMDAAPLRAVGISSTDFHLFNLD